VDGRLSLVQGERGVGPIPHRAICVVAVALGMRASARLFVALTCRRQVVKMVAMAMARRKRAENADSALAPRLDRFACWR
jgi:hypothetical protein